MVHYVWALGVILFCFYFQWFYISEMLPRNVVWISGSLDSFSTIWLSYNCQSSGNNVKFILRIKKTLNFKFLFSSEITLCNRNWPFWMSKNEKSEENHNFSKNNLALTFSRSKIHCTNLWNVLQSTNYWIRINKIVC